MSLASLLSNACLSACLVFGLEFGQQRQQNTLDLLAKLKAEDEANGQACIAQEAGK